MGPLLRCCCAKRENVSRCRLLPPINATSIVFRPPPFSTTFNIVFCGPGLCTNGLCHGLHGCVNYVWLLFVRPVNAYGWTPWTPWFECDLGAVLLRPEAAKAAIVTHEQPPAVSGCACGLREEPRSVVRSRQISPAFSRVDSALHIFDSLHKAARLTSKHQTAPAAKASDL